jgi:hypothetical protein
VVELFNQSATTTAYEAPADSGHYRCVGFQTLREECVGFQRSVDTARRLCKNSSSYANDAVTQHWHKSAGLGLFCHLSFSSLAAFKKMPVVSTSELIPAPHIQPKYVCKCVYVSVLMKNERRERNHVWSCEILPGQSPDQSAWVHVRVFDRRGGGCVSKRRMNLCACVWMPLWVSWKLCSPIIAAFTSTLIFCALCDFALFANHLHILGTNRLRIFICAYESLFVGSYRATFHACTFEWLIGCFSIVEKINFFLWSPLWVGRRLGCAHCKHNILILKEVRGNSVLLARQWHGGGKRRENKRKNNCRRE